MESEKLMPCPFCGCDKLVEWTIDGLPSITCENCLVTVMACPDKELLKDIWNRRSADDHK